MLFWSCGVAVLLSCARDTADCPTPLENTLTTNTTNANNLIQTNKKPIDRTAQTIENTREKDVTLVEEGDADVELDEGDDEFAAHFARRREPKVLITTCYKPSAVMYSFISEMLVRERWAEIGGI